MWVHGCVWQVPDDAIAFLASVCDGDARVALNALDMAAAVAPADHDGAHVPHPYYIISCHRRAARQR